MNATFVQAVRDKGIVGAGGAGFPTYVKLQKPVKRLLINGAECEPLLHKDKELLKNFGQTILEGMVQVRDCLQAEEAVLGIKGKYTEVIALLTPLLPSGIRIHPLEDYYPAGDEFCLVYEITGDIIPPGGLPLHVGAVVMNVETILNIMDPQPVVAKYLTVACAVNEPKTIRVPIGITVREAIDFTGGASVDDYAVISGGAMMGRLIDDLDTPITKTTGGLLVFPQHHSLLAKYRQDFDTINKIGRSSCDQCFHCTELCPRYLLGHPIEPHRAMRSLGFSHDKVSHVLGTQFCCECNLCTLLACPEALDPKNVCTQNKQMMRENNLTYPDPIPERDVHSMRNGRKTPVSRLIRKLDLHTFVNKGPLSTDHYTPSKVTLPFRQHVGAPAQPVVSVGAKVRIGDIVANVSQDQLGVPIHASIDGTVSAITDTCIEIARG
jgi:Na+-translocating ferredoxin:NAD+ oxidoreductase RnfC subunit